jgi:hypothetical protein
MCTRQVRQLGLDGGEVPGLDLDQQFASNDVDHEPVEGDLESIPGARIPLLECFMERLLVQDANVWQAGSTLGR